MSAQLKEKANLLYKNNDYTGAIDLYTQAFELDSTNPILLLNRATARHRLEENGLAIADCTTALDMDPTLVKAFYRRGVCNLSIMKFTEALADFRSILKLDSSNAVARQQADATKKLIDRKRFEAAISGPEQILCSVEVLKMLPDLKTDGEAPRLDSNAEGHAVVTQEFVDAMLEWFKAGKALHKKTLWELVLAVQRILLAESSLKSISIPHGHTIDIIGDVHGQLYDVLHLLSLTGPPSDTHSLLFNGDFVDRGSWSTEVVILLFAWKCLWPERVFLNRGNHEATDMNKVYGFEGECKHKYGPSDMTFRLFTEVFTALPLASLIEPLQPAKSPKKDDILCGDRKRYFVVHGGLFSKDGVTLKDINNIKRVNQQPGQSGLMCELLWTDPQVEKGRGPSKRGVGIAFGPDVTQDWCRLNQVTAIFRSHEMREGGYEIQHDGRCTTIFSAPNYCDQGGNLGAFVRVDAEGELEYKTFEAKPHPNIRPMAYSTMPSM